jgi:hypothetical protein
MARKATSARRQIIMAALLAGAVAGWVIRELAPDPSTLRDVGTLMLVLWLPAIGNVIAFVVRRIPRAAPQQAPMPFGEGTAFVAHLRANLAPVALPAGFVLDPATSHGTLISGQQGFTVRLDQPLATWLADPVAPVALQCLRPEVALRALGAGTKVHLLAGTTAIASGTVAETLA